MHVSAYFCKKKYEEKVPKTSEIGYLQGVKRTGQKSGREGMTLLSILFCIVLPLCLIE